MRLTLGWRHGWPQVPREVNQALRSLSASISLSSRRYTGVNTLMIGYDLYHRSPKAYAARTTSAPGTCSSSSRCLPFGGPRRALTKRTPPGCTSGWRKPEARGRWATAYRPPPAAAGVRSNLEACGPLRAKK
jgi:hypothetical protein